MSEPRVPTDYGYFRVGARDVIENAEQSTEWPRDCFVCHHERGVTESAASQEEAVAHRKKKHHWLDDGLAAARADALAEIRAGVEGLRQWWAFDDTPLVSRDAVLALLDPPK